MAMSPTFSVAASVVMPPAFAAPVSNKCPGLQLLPSHLGLPFTITAILAYTSACAAS